MPPYRFCLSTYLRFRKWGEAHRRLKQPSCVSPRSRDRQTERPTHPHPTLNKQMLEKQTRERAKDRMKSKRGGLMLPIVQRLVKRSNGVGGTVPGANYSFFQSQRRPMDPRDAFQLVILLADFIRRPPTVVHNFLFGRAKKQKSSGAAGSSSMR